MDKSLFWTPVAKEDLPLEGRTMIDLGAQLKAVRSALQKLQAERFTLQLEIANLKTMLYLTHQNNDLDHPCCCAFCLRYQGSEGNDVGRV